MAENTVEKKRKTSWFKGLKAEFKKIIWPDKKTLLKQTVAVIVSIIIIGLLILIVDMLVGGAIKELIKKAPDAIAKLFKK